MKKFVINLDKRTDRKQFFLSVNSFLQDVEFVSAIDKDKITNQSLAENNMFTNKTWRDPFRNRTITRGEVACFLSHARTWRKCIDINEPIMIFEDDAVVDESKFDEPYYEQLIEKYGFIYLSRNENEPEKVKPIDDRIEFPAYPYNMTAYVIHPKAARILLSSDIFYKIIPVDEFLPMALERIGAIALIEDVANQASRDDLGSDIEPNSEDDYLIDFIVHPITVGDDRKRCIPLNDSGTLNGVYPKNLGTNVKWEGGDMTTPGGGMKINLLKEHLKNLPDNDVVLFTDAFDVFYADDLNTIVKRYLGFHTKVLFSAESECYPDASLEYQYPTSETPYRFLNSGTFIGRVGELKEILKDDIAHDDDDQLYYTKKFLSGRYDIKLDYEGYIFQTTDNAIEKVGTQMYNPRTQTFGCIYHGNGGDDAKETFDRLYNQFYPKLTSLLIPSNYKYDIIEKDMLVVDFMTQSQCEDLIDIADRHGGWGSLSYDKFPAQEIRMKELGFWDELEKHWEKHIYPIVEQYWSPMEMYGLRDAFVMRYAMDTQASLAYHTDASLVTGSVKLNDDYEGAELVYHRQGVSNKDIAVGRCILFPGMVTHGHECLPLKSGVKYSLTMWSSRYQGDIV